MISINSWLYNAIVRQGDILAVHPDYFQLTGGLERWLYRLARKAVPDKADPPAIRFKMETLHERSGVTRDLKLFAFDVRKIAETQPLPEYGIQIEYRRGRRELVTLYRDKAKPCRPRRGRRLATVRGDQIEPFVDPKARPLSDIGNDDAFDMPIPATPLPVVIEADERKGVPDRAATPAARPPAVDRGDDPADDPKATLERHRRQVVYKRWP